MDDFIFHRAEAENEPETENEGKYATFQQRFGGLMIDVGLLTIIAIIIATVTKDLPEDIGYLRLILFILILFTYEPFMIITGGTLGHRAMKIRVRKQKNDAININLLQAYVRLIVKLFTGPLRGFNWINKKKNQAIHDLAAGSVVINVDQ